MKKFYRITLLGLAPIGFIMGLLIFLEFILFFLMPPCYDEKIVQVVNIPPGSSLTKISTILRRKGVIRNQTLFSLLAQFRGIDTRIQAGEYQLSNQMLPNELLDKLRRGEQIEYSIIIPEGYTLVQTAELYRKMGLADKDKMIQLATDPHFISSLGIEEKSLEGYLFPDTYTFIRNIGEKNIIRRMVRNFHDTYEPFRSRARAKKISRREVITLASIIEKETGKSEERSLISAVFHNRLKKNMRLESDPTVIYGLAKFKGGLTKKDLLTYTRYNTYVIHGLPPTPIANPGRDSIRAALYPAPVDYLFFVSKNDGTHYFSKSFAEHKRAVLKYQRRFRKRNGT